MSIDEWIEELTKQRKLVLRPSSFMGDSARNVFLLPEIDAIAKSPFEDSDQGDRDFAVAAFLDAFAELNEITVSENPRRKPAETMLARVEPEDANFWSMRITEPEGTAGVRIIGAFCAKDCFVGLVCENREYIGSFSDSVDDAIAIWHELFGNIEPPNLGDLSGYITNYKEY